MSNVYIVNVKSHLDYTSAKQYGKFVPITVGNINILRPQKVMEHVKNVLHNYKEGDYILLSGNSLAVYLVTNWLLISRPDISFHNILIYDSRISKYIVHKINLLNFTADK